MQANNGLKRCIRCKQEKSVHDFSRNNSAIDGLQGSCKPCQREIGIARRQKAKMRNAALSPSVVAPPPLPLQAAPVAATTPVPPPPAPPPPPVTIAERIELARLRTDKARLAAQLAELQDEVVGATRLKDLIGSLGAPCINSQPEWLAGAKDPSSSVCTPLAMLSDVHWDEVVQRDQVNGANEYHREIAQARMQNFTRNTIRILRTHLAGMQYDGIILCYGGDGLSGNIHEELRETNAAPINLSIVAFEEALIECIIAWADEFGRVHVPWVTGNHGRYDRKPRYKNRAHENFEWLIGQRVASYFKNDPRVTFDIADGADCVFDVYRRRYRLIHGDSYQGGNGIGGIMVPVRRGIAKDLESFVGMGDRFEVSVIGHFHQLHLLDDLIINGSLKGFDEYAMANHFKYERAQQALWVEHPEHGMTFRAPILVDKES